MENETQAQDSQPVQNEETPQTQDVNNSGNETQGSQQEGYQVGDTQELQNMAFAVWVAHLAGLVTSGLGGIVAVVIGYMKREEAKGSTYADHFDQGIRTF